MVRVALQRLLQDPPPLRVCFLIHNDQIQSKLAHSIRLSRSKEPPPQGSCISNRVFLRLLNALPFWLSGQRGQRLLQQVGSARTAVAQKPNPAPPSRVYHIKQTPNPSRPFCSQKRGSSSQTRIR